MRSILTASILAASALAFSACTVSTADRGEDDSEIDTGESAGALSTYGKALVGTYETADAASPFDTIVLNKNGTYKTTENVQCFAASCDPVTDFGKFIGYRPANGGKIGGLRLVSAKNGTSKQYRVALTEANVSFQLLSNGQWFKYGKPAPKCDSTDGRTYMGTPETCPLIRFACAEGFEHFSDACGCGCVKSSTSCDYSDTSVKWVSKDPAQCAATLFVCVEGTESFFSDCGCGCKPAAEPVAPYTGEGCERAGCSGQVCAEAGSGIMTTCLWREEYACYAKARCEKQATGTCGWTKTPELSACITAATAQ